MNEVFNYYRMNKLIKIISIRSNLYTLLLLPMDELILFPNGSGQFKVTKLRRFTEERIFSNDWRVTVCNATAIGSK